MAREKQFNSYCPKCMGKLEPCEDAISRAEAMNVLDALYLDGESAQGFTADANEDCLIGKYKAIEILDELPSVQPEPFINKPCVSKQACHEDKMKVLEKIKAEIEAKCCITVGRECDGAITLHDVFEIIDKYKAESEDKA